MRRILDICVLSDVHLGTNGCHAEELFRYLRTIKPRVLILNGDIVDAWQFRKNYFPRPHLEVIHHILQMSIQGTKVYYLTGNHDDILRRFSDLNMGPIVLKDSLVLQIQSKKYWFFHGDIFDAAVLVSPFLARIGSKSYDWLIRLNRWTNRTRTQFGMRQVSFAHTLKARVKQAVKYVSDFENMAIKQAQKHGHDYVICGHIHRPCIRSVEGGDRKVIYMNAGDWVENLSALEFKDGIWKLFSYKESLLVNAEPAVEPAIHSNSSASQAVSAE